MKMNFSAHEKLIKEASSPQGLLYKIILVYVTAFLLIIAALTFMFGSLSNVNSYALINFFTVVTITWFIRRSFRIFSLKKGMALLRLGLFLMMNSSMISLAGGLNIISRDSASLVAAIIYAPSLIIMILSFNDFLAYADQKYNHAINLSLTDELTGLPNRRHMNIKLKELEGKKGAICIADIDYFKKINDTYGHERGDDVLRSLGSHFSKFITDEVFIARSGGEEFSFIFLGKMEVERDISMIKESLSALENSDSFVTLSIGVARKYPEASVASTLSSADGALYEAKRAGRDRIVYSPAKK